jgi:hypothetical protein
MFVWIVMKIKVADLIAASEYNICNDR